MPFADQMIAGGQLMLLGMGIVFGFLVLLVFALKLMSVLADKLPPAQVVFPEEVTGPSEAEETEIIAVISAAIRCYRQQRSN